MTANGSGFGGKIAARRRLIASEIAKAECRLNSLETKRLDLIDELQEISRLKNDRQEYDRALAKALDNCKGRPGKWKGRDGYDLVARVMKLQGDNLVVAAAIRSLKQENPQRWRQPQRVLERRFQEAKRYWQQWIQLEATLETRERDFLIRLARRDL
jgi:hypothetical protein